MSLNSATLKLFNAIQLTKKQRSSNLLLDQTIKNGYVLSPEVAAVATPTLLKEIESVVGLSGEKANSSFHKSWGKVANTPLAILYLEQIIHYFTTYGLELTGESVYIPNEALEIPTPRFDGGVKLTVIRGLTRDEILESLRTLIGGIALSKEVLEAIMEIDEANHFGASLLTHAKNRELKIRLYERYGLLPNDPEDFVRYAIFKLTGESLVIKNPAMIKKILEADKLKGKWLDSVLGVTPANLASVFYRYKPLFLAMKKISKNKYFWNNLRREAVKKHVPMEPSYLNTVTYRLKKGFPLTELDKQLNSVNIFRKVRLAQALSYRMNPGENILFRVRNGKSFVTDFHFPRKLSVVETLGVVLNSIAKSLNVAGQIYYIPDSFEIAIPATEKQFIGNIPAGSYISTSQAMIAGVHWNNVSHHRIDLDLASMAITGEKVGWDARYRDGGILFSGDMTDASGKNGASELIYFPNNKQDSQLLTLNYFNHSENVPVPFSILVASSEVKPRWSGSRMYGGGGQNYMIDPNNLLATSKSEMTEKQQVLGLMTHSEGKNRFHFMNTSMGNTRSSRGMEYLAQTQQYLLDSLEAVISLREVLILAGATVTESRPEHGTYVDLSPEALDKTTLLKILTT